MARNDTAARAGVIDVQDIADADSHRKGYRPGTTFTIAGKRVKLDDVPDYMAGERRPKAKRKSRLAH